MPDPIAKPGDRSRGGGIITTAGELRVGDRLEFMGAARAVFFPITECEDTPKMVRLTINTGHFSPAQTVRMRKTTLCARGLREGETYA